MRLTPAKGTETFGRDGFLIHGDNAAQNASEGCIILALGLRRDIAASGDKSLVVVS